MILYSIVQIILAILLVFFLLFLANLIYNYESVVNMRNTYTVRKEIIIFDGYTDFSLAQWSFNTYNSNSGTYKEMKPSINQDSGAEYTYNFWLYVDKNKMADNFDPDHDIVLLLRGSKVQLPYKNDANCRLKQKNKYIMIKNPLIRMQSNGNAIVLEYNTITNPDAYREHGKTAINCNGTWFDKNKGMLGIYQLSDPIYDKKWFMLTFVLREINTENDILYKNKTNCKIYVNGINVMERTVESPYSGEYGSAVMKHNLGMLYVNPGDIYNDNDAQKDVNPFAGHSDVLKMANLTYFNYALSEAEVLQLFNKGFSKKLALMPLKETDSEGDMFSISSLSEKNNNLPLPF